MRNILSLKTNHEARSGPRRRINLTGLSPSYTFYVIGDVHGCLRELQDAENRIAADIAGKGQKAIVVLLGDYIDRGPESAAVLDYLIENPRPGLRRIPLCGNHDDTFLKYVEEPTAAAAWLEFGGLQTLLSYGIDALHIFRRGGGAKVLKEIISEVIPTSHIEFVRNLPISLSIGTHFFVHAGIVPGRPLAEQADGDLLWIREPFLSKGPQLPITVVHGHSYHTEPFFGTGRIGIDTGAYITGRLTVLRIRDCTEVII